MTFEERFEKISTKFKKADTSVLTDDFAIQVNLLDEDCGGIFYIANISGNFSVEPYDYYDHTSMLSIMADDFMKLTAGSLSIDNGIAKGRFSVKGNLADIKILPTLFPKAVKKTPAKKAPVKKTEEIKVAKTKEKADAKGRKL